MSQAFTIDGSPELEKRLERLCERVLDRVRAVIPPARFDALVLGGGYGRGEGGVLRTDQGDQPYNDLEYYIFLRGNRLLNVRRFTPPLEELSEALSSEAGLHVEFKVDSLRCLASRPVSMFSYDLVARHRVVAGDPGAFDACRHHLDPARIPPFEATRLLWNRCSGLLLAKQLLRQERFEADDADFVGRNLAKAWLAMGDAVLAAHGGYHWSCLVRRRRLASLKAGDLPPRFERILRHHTAGAEFKLHPRRCDQTREELEHELRETSALAESLWLWLERKRLRVPFGAPRDYSLSRASKCPERRSLLNPVLNVRALGWRSVFERSGWRYPRERLLNAMPLLLWDEAEEPRVREQVRQVLGAPASDWDGLVAAYRQLWSSYG